MSNMQLLLAVSELVCKMVDIESLSVSGLTTPAVTRIATYSKLRHLELRAFKADNILMLSESSFPELSELTLTTTEDATRLGEFIAIIRPKKLRKLSMALLRGSCPSEEWEVCFQPVARYCSGTLEILCIEQGGIGSRDIHNMEPEAFEPLFALRQLTELSVTCGCLGLDNDDLKQMALFWPRLQKLSIEPDLGSRSDPSDITLDGLVPLLEHCPDLCALSLVLDASFVTMPHPPTRPGGGVSNHKIVAITVGLSDIEDPVLVAAFLSDILPNLREITWEDPDQDATRKTRTVTTRTKGVVALCGSKWGN